MAKKMASQGDTSIKDNLRWTEEMDAFFLDALIEECNKRNRVDGTFTTTAYDNVLETLKASFGNHLRKDNLKNRLKTLKDHFGTRPDAKTWMRTPIKHYDNLYFIYGQDRITENIAGSAKERNKSMAKMKKTINLNEDEYQGFDYMLKDGNNYYDKSLGIALKQMLTAERQAETAEKQDMLVERQVLIAEEQIQVAKIQAQAVERGITFLKQSRARIYSENDVYNEIKKLGVVKEIFWSCYRFLCRDERAKGEFFDVPFEDCHGALYDLMKEAGAI
ncbi:hypothetical protein Ahy_A08g039150 [Arachis hypogaea]|uniref:Myb/SANT-like domain-containing protein n=1 Tax=Arachis hypogaea TaxID=3818 RepID=A0A445BVW8_ARAHY|nr:hypothetical protein Ahy_A08g039150 [Arachis hypogaea]